VNASYLVDRGAAVMIRDEHLNQVLLEKIRDLIFDQQKLKRMSQAMAELATPEAAANIAQMIIEMTESE
jgi:UDP-N-acetylglucosamine--N-acetylmuramyl-(pentapeptide) pyrophosphoryl-undecaprenol N-acetylglucosamine transferase